MRISIAKVVFCEPEILMLDEPTNHLDLVALIWLEQYIMSLTEVTVIIVSHAKDFLNNVVDEIIELSNKKLIYYRGNFDTFEKVKGEQIKQRIKKREYQLEEIAHNQKFVDQFRANAKRATLVQSRLKVIAKITESMEEEIFQESSYVFRFPVPPRLERPLLRITDGVLGYTQDTPILKGVMCDFDMDTRIAFVGPNGAGKSTLIKTLTGKIANLDGQRIINGKLKIGLFDQHHFESLNPRLSALETFLQRYPTTKGEPLMRHLGSFGVSDKLAKKPMQLLSGGQKSRVAFALITYEEP
jgi:ATP-binding cassette subfamily F protein 3